MSLIKVRKIATLDGEDKRDGKDSIAADAKDSARNVKYRGCEITVAYHNPDNVNLSGKTWIVKDVDGVSVGGFSSEAKAKAWIDAHPSRTADSRAASDAAELNSDADLRAADGRGTDSKFKVGDKVKLSGSHPRFPNKVGVVTHVFPTGFVKVKVDGIEDIEIAERLISKAEDAAEKGSRELQNVFHGALYALKKVADRAKVEGAQTLVDAANSAAKELTSKSYTVF